MPRLSNTRKPCMNTSIRLFRKNNVLNTSRKILQKSINRSVLCATTLKSNNASLAKRLGELQIELNAQRTATLEAKTESTRLRFELVRLRARIDSKGKLKDNLLTMRELVVSMCDSGMALLRCVNEVSSVFDSMLGLDQSVVNHSNRLSDTVADLSHVFTIPEPSRAMAPAVPMSSSTSSTMTTVTNSPQPMILLRRPPPIDDSQLPIPSPDPSRRIPQSAMVQSISEARPVNRSLASSGPPNQPAAVVVQLDSPQPPPKTTITTITAERSIPTISNEPNVASSAAANTENLSDRCSPTTRQSRADRRPPVIQDSPPIDFNLPPTPPKGNCPSAVVARTHLNRAARLKSKPIIDDSSSPVVLPKPPHGARSKRRRLCHNDDSDDEYDGGGGNGEVKPSMDDNPFKVPLAPAPRTVEVHVKRPGQVAFRAETKHAHEPGPSSRSKKKSDVKSTTTTTATTRSKSKSPVIVVARLPEPTRPKSVFDISANQTANLSLLPPTLDELRKQELHKRLAHQSGRHDSPTTSVFVVSTNSEPTKGGSSPKLCLSSQLGNRPSKTPSVDTATTVKPPNAASKPSAVRRSRFRRLCLNDDDDHGTPDNDGDVDADKENRRSSTGSTTSSVGQKPRGRPRSQAARTK